MKFLVPLALLTVITAGSLLPVWLPLPPLTPTHSPLPVLPVAAVNARSAEAVSHLEGFVTSPVAVAAPSVLTDVYFYEGQYVRRGQVLAKLKVRPTNAVAYLNATHDGVLARAGAAVGDLLLPGTPLTTLTDQTRLLVRLHPVAARHLHPGDSVHISLANSGGPAVRGKITGWTAAGKAAPLLTLQLRRSLAGAAVGVPLTVATAQPAGLPAPATAYVGAASRELTYAAVVRR